MSKKYHFRERMFLNINPEMRAYVIAVVENTSDFPACCEEYRKGGEIILEIASCYDEINLHFDMATEADRENSLFKATKLAEIANAFREAIEREVKGLNERTIIHQHARAASAVH
jgi:hypothetical protein